jgi:hypothetical protein
VLNVSRDEKQYSGMDYQDEVEAKEQAEEVRIAKQANSMLSPAAQRVVLSLNRILLPRTTSP